MPPVLILAVCAISARFSTHPQINSEPEFLRGEEWAAPARDIALKHYDEPSITILTVLLILGLHEFGTCQGGRSWMLGGMAMRMAYALQLHRELDHDPLGQNDKGSELSFTDREIRRRTMWACFLMDRFNSSGTERPTCANEETIKVQLPIKESYFQMEIPGPTEDLDGYVQNSMASDTGQISNPKDNMGVASYIIRIIALWGRVIKYVNLGGRESDKCAIWKSQSEFAQLKKQAEGFQTQLPSTLQNTQDNLRTHAAEKLANQFLLMHIASYQVILFLHRFAVPSTQASKNMNDMPETFVAEAGRSAMDAANQISELLTDAIEYSVFAPFAGYCAFMSSTIQVWGIFSTNSALAIASKKNLVRNIQYLGKMKKYWGMFHFMKQNLKDIYLQHREAFTKGSNPSETITGVFQYGDWFQKYPHGVSKSEYESPAKEIKEEPGGGTSANKNLDPQRVEEELLKHFPPPSLPASSRKSLKRQNKKPLQASPSYVSKSDSQAPLNSQLPPIQQPIIPIQLSNPHPAISPPPFSPHHTQTFFPSNQAPVVFPPTYDILPQLDRRLVYGAYAGSDPTASSSTTAFNALTAHNNLHVQNPSDIRTNPNLWDPTAAMTNPAGYQQQQVALDEVSQSAGYMGMSDMQTSAWFMPFNLNPPEIGLDGDEFGNVTFGPFGMGDGMGGS